MPILHLLLADENFSKATVEHLQEAGHDVITLDSLGLAQIGFPDEAVLKKATELKRCILTFNRLDFIKLHKSSKDHAGIIVCTYNRDKEQLAEKIHKNIIELESLNGQLIRIYRD